MQKKGKIKSISSFPNISFGILQEPVTSKVQLAHFMLHYNPNYWIQITVFFAINTQAVGL